MYYSQVGVASTRIYTYVHLHIHVRVMWLYNCVSLLVRSFAMSTCSRRKQKVLSIEQKLEICQRLRGGTSSTVLSKELEITICLIIHTN